jgi:hypothetical protein
MSQSADTERFHGISILISTFTDKECTLITSLLSGKSIFGLNTYNVELMIETVNENALYVIGDNIIECMGGQF